MWPEVDLHLSNGASFKVKAPGVSETNRYVASATWNGKPWHKAWFMHEDLMRGGTLVLTMEDHPGKWFTGPPPPSTSAGD